MKKWDFYTSDEIRPQGWLKRQLEIQAAGLNGNLDKIWPDVRDSAWIGGNREDWERVPYWLDGFIPLAYLLKNQDMIARAKKYMDAILSSQRPDGWICPCAEEDIPTYDSWPVLLISKVLTVYYDCSKDERIPDALYRAMKNYWSFLKSGTIHLFGWAEYRWFEGFPALDFLEQRFHEEWISELAVILEQQGCHYADIREKWKRPLNRWTYGTHIVNIGMMLKSEAVSCDLLHRPYTDEAGRLWDMLDAYNGTPAAIFTGDECLAGLSAIRGTELCSVVELMYSYELLFARTGDPKWAERLETAAFNALPATVSGDMWTHQYDQLSNQIACQKFSNRPLFGTNGGDSHLFGLEPCYGCCTANFGQGWPKFALSAFMHTENEVLSVIPVPSELHTADLHITVKTAYPFENSFVYEAEARKAFTLRIRIPSFARNLQVDGKAETPAELAFPIAAGEHRTIRISFETVPRLERRPHDLYTVKCGSLIFSVPIRYEKIMQEYEKDQVPRRFPYCDYELRPCSPWNYAYCDTALQWQTHEISDIPFSSAHPPVTVKALVQPIAWGYEEGYDTVCAKVPASREPVGKPQEMELFPYGCAKLRMTEIPLI